MTDGSGTSEVRCGPVAIRCASPDAVAALDAAVAAWHRDHPGQDIFEDGGPYRTLYWLFRYSGVMAYAMAPTGCQCPRCGNWH